MCKVSEVSEDSILAYGSGLRQFVRRDTWREACIIKRVIDCQIANSLCCCKMVGDALITRRVEEPSQRETRAVMETDSLSAKSEQRNASDESSVERSIRGCSIQDVVSNHESVVKTYISILG